jgi:hypothetical protein
MKKVTLLLSIVLLSLSLLQAQYTLTDNDINFKKASYNASMIVVDSNNLVLNLSTSLSDNLQETSRMHLLTYANFPKLGLGIGAKFNTRFKDYYKMTTAEFLIAKKIELKEKSLLNFGLNLGVDYLGVNENFFNGFVDQSDEFITNNPNQSVRFMSGFGTSYVWDNKFQIAFSMPELIKSQSDFYPTVFANMAYKQSLGKTKALYLKPEVMVYSTDIAPVTIEGSASFGFQNNIWMKMGGRSNKTMLVGMGGGFSFIEVGYNYNMNFSNYDVVNQMQHNINLCFNFVRSDKYESNANTNGNSNFNDDGSDVFEVEDSTYTMYPYLITTSKVESEIEADWYVAVESFKKKNAAVAAADEKMAGGQKAFIVREVNTGIYHVCLAFDNEFKEIVSKVLLLKNSIAPGAWLIEND